MGSAMAAAGAGAWIVPEVVSRGVPAAAASGCDIGENLIANPSAETNTPAVSPAGSVLLTSWTTTAGEPRGMNYGATDFPTTSDLSPAPAVGPGSYLFYGGQVASSFAQQDIDVSGCAASIDAHTRGYTLSAYIGGNSTQTDRATVRAQFLNSIGGQTGQVTIGPVTNANRSNVTRLLFRTASGLVPINTRTVRVRLEFTRDEGTNNDGYLDLLSFVLS